MHPILKKYQENNRFGQANGLELEVVEPGHIRYQMAVKEEHLALVDVVHGGVLAGLMDAVLSVAGLSLVADFKKAVGTVEFKINYLRPARPGDILIAEGRVTQSGKRLLTVEGDIKNQDGKALAVGLGTLNAYPAEIAGLDNV